MRENYASLDLWSKFFLQMAHDDKTGGHFGFSKTLARLRHNTRDVKGYVTGCLVFQQKKDHGGK